eukprot:GHVT01085765.1.p1 GENE.GHVT01085765.1~~GHVT01085765.1.p1  ORF type:complete len:663 (-),score=120.78 GHVT01085765.1:1018-3006(-)
MKAMENVGPGSHLVHIAAALAAHSPARATRRLFRSGCPAARIDAALALVEDSQLAEIGTAGMVPFIVTEDCALPLVVALVRAALAVPVDPATPAIALTSAQTSRLCRVLRRSRHPSAQKLLRRVQQRVSPSVPPARRLPVVDAAALRHLRARRERAAFETRRARLLVDLERRPTISAVSQQPRSGPHASKNDPLIDVSETRSRSRLLQTAGTTEQAAGLRADDKQPRELQDSDSETKQAHLAIVNSNLTPDYVKFGSSSSSSGNNNNSSSSSSSSSSSCCCSTGRVGEADATALNSKTEALVALTDSDDCAHVNDGNEETEVEVAVQSGATVAAAGAADAPEKSCRDTLFQLCQELFVSFGRPSEPESSQCGTQGEFDLGADDISFDFSAPTTSIAEALLTACASSPHELAYAACREFLRLFVAEDDGMSRCVKFASAFILSKVIRGSSSSCLSPHEASQPADPEEPALFSRAHTIAPVFLDGLLSHVLLPCLLGVRFGTAEASSGLTFGPSELIRCLDYLATAEERRVAEQLLAPTLQSTSFSPTAIQVVDHLARRLAPSGRAKALTRFIAAPPTTLSERHVVGVQSLLFPPTGRKDQAVPEEMHAALQGVWRLLAAVQAQSKDQLPNVVQLGTATLGSRWAARDLPIIAEHLEAVLTQNG